MQITHSKWPLRGFLNWFQTLIYGLSYGKKPPYPHLTHPRWRVSTKLKDDSAVLDTLNNHSQATSYYLGQSSARESWPHLLSLIISNEARKVIHAMKSIYQLPLPGQAKFHGQPDRESNSWPSECQPSVLTIALLRRRALHEFVTTIAEFVHPMADTQN